jgi:signal transduction histidine kinase
MMVDAISNIASCYVVVPALSYYSHIPTAAVALLLGVFVYFKTRTDRLLTSRMLLFTAVAFSVWSILDLYLWIGTDSRGIMFAWSLVNLFGLLASSGTLYFSYVFLEKKDAPLIYKISVCAALSFFVVFLPTKLNLIGFDSASCEATQGTLTYYYYILEIVFFLWLVGYLFKKIVNTSGENRKITAYFSIGAVCFLASFSMTNIVASVTENWKILQYGLFGMPIFMGFLAYLIVRFNAFNIKLLGAQALTVAQFLLIDSMLFFSRSEINQVLTLLTLLITTGAGWFLVKSIKKEIERKEELQMMSDRLATANQELKRLDNAKSEFISIASHQLRTPLTAIKGYTSLMLEGSYGKIDNQIQDVINKVYSANNRLIDLVENLLSISRLESGRMQYNFQLTQLADIVQDTISMFAVIAKKQNTELIVVTPEMPLPLMSLDAGKIREVISNLVDNALKYTSQNGSVTVKMEQVDDEKVRLSIKDTGIGIHKEDLEHIFLKFARSKETEKLYVGGTGLGLYVGRTFIEKHGGRLWAESVGPGQGSEFICELPISRDSV